MTTRRIGILLALILAPLIALWKPLVLGTTIGPFDQVRQFAPWNGPKPSAPWDILEADAVLQFYPWRKLVLEGWGRHEVPFWNPYELAGTPLLANSQSAPFYPPHIVLGIAHLPVDYAITFLAWFHLTWAGLGLFVLIRRLGGVTAGALTGGLAFSLSAFMLGWTGLASVITTVAWIPWVLVCIEALFDQNANAKKWRLGLAGSTAMMVLAGHLQFVAYGAIAAVAYLVLRSVFERKPLVGLVGLVCFGCGFLVAAPQLLPVLDNSKFSHRRNTPDENGYQGYISGALQPYELGMIGDAFATGNPRSWTEMRDGERPSYWGYLAKRGANLAESAITLGPLILGLLLLAPWKDRRTWGVGLILITFSAIALGTAVNRLLFFYIPGWSSTASPGRAGVLFVMMSCVLAGLAVRQIQEKKLSVIFVMLPLFAVLLASLPAKMAPVPKDISEPVFRAITEAPFSGGLPILIGITVCALIALAIGISTRKTFLLPIAAVICTLPYALVLVENGQPMDKVEGPDASSRIAVVNKQWGIEEAPKSLMPPNLASASGLHELGGYDSILNRDTVEFLKTVIGGRNPAPAWNGNIMFVKGTILKDKLIEAGVSEVWSQYQMPQLGKPTGMGDQFAKYSVGGNRADVAGRPVINIEDGLSFTRFKAMGPGHLTLRDRNMPGWSLRIDGKPAAIGGNLWMEADLPSGQHSIEFTYQAPGFKNGVLLAMLGLAVAFVLAFVGQSRKPVAMP